jgi:beta-glucosidase
VTISSDPRHGYAENFAARVGRDRLLAVAGADRLRRARRRGRVREFGDIARREYRAVGIHVALHPMADLATEPRWARSMHTFGEDAELAARSSPRTSAASRATSSGPSSVACMTKHFPAAGRSSTARTRTSRTARIRCIPGGMFEYHLTVFEAAFAAGTAQIMPTTGARSGRSSKEVGFGFNRDVVTGLLRGALRLRRASSAPTGGS